MDGVLLVLDQVDPRSAVDALASECDDETQPIAAFVSDHAVPVLTTGSDDWTPETWTLLGSLAHQTSSCQIGSLVSPLLLYQTRRLADAILTVDALSAGRLVVGLGTGWHEGDFHAYGQEFTSAKARREAFVERLSELDDLLRRGQPDRRIPLIVGSFGAALIRATSDLADGFCSFGPPDVWLERHARVDDPAWGNSRQFMVLASLVESAESMIPGVLRRGEIVAMCTSLADLPAAASTVRRLRTGQ